MKAITKKIWRAGPVVAAVAVVLAAALPAWAGLQPPPDAISVPEPGTLGLLATGIAVVAYLRYRK